MADVVLVCRLHTSGTMGTPSCVGRIVLNDSEHVMYGDSLGMVNMIIADTSEPFKNRDLLCTEHTQDYVCLHEKHSEWVTKVLNAVLSCLASIIHSYACEPACCSLPRVARRRRGDAGSLAFS